MKQISLISRSQPIRRFSSTRTLKSLLILFSIAISLNILGQSGALKGKIYDKDTKEPIPFANVILYGDSAIKAGATSDFDGNYIMKPIAPGSYYLEATYIGYKSIRVEGITINADQIRFYDIGMEPTATVLEEIVVTSYSVPFISKDCTVSGGYVSGEEIRKMPGKTSVSVSSFVGGVYSADGERGDMRESRSDASLMYIDGIRVSGSSSLPVSDIEHVRLDDDKKIPEPEKKPDPEKPETVTDRFQARLLTAGEINDFSKWKLWKDISGDELKGYQSLWKIIPENRYCVQVINENSYPVVGCDVKLLDNNNNLVWASKTDNSGKAELWSDMFGKDPIKQKQYRVEVEYGGISKTIKRPKRFHKGINSVRLGVPCNSPEIVDILFTVDATGSMSDEINYLKAELKDIIKKFSDSNPKLQLRLGSVFYRDKSDNYVTLKSDFSTDIQQTIDFIGLQSAGGGGDTPEAVDEALDVSINDLSWSNNARARLMFLILDAPPHQATENINKLQQAIDKAARSGIKIIPITASGIDKSTEYLMRAFALATNGTYVFLTNDSGIGGNHIKPSIDDYTVELLNDLILRLLKQFTFVEDCHKVVEAQENMDTAKKEITNQVVEIVEQTDSVPEQKDEFQGGKEKIKGKIWVKAYPIPSHGLVTIESGKKTKEVFLIDLSGKIIMRIPAPDRDKTKLELYDLPNGMYFLKYANVDHWDYVKIILSH